MIKTKLINPDGKSGKEIELPKIFSGKIREDIAQKYFEAVKRIQPYGPNIVAGMLYSASGKLRHMRHKWKTTYGRGISRIPRKIFWRRGTQFYWEGATASSTRGGRRAHPPRPEHFQKKLKINKKEKKIAFISAITSTASPDYLQKRYSTLSGKKLPLHLPLIADSGILKLNTKQFNSLMKNILNEAYSVAVKKKSVRAGRGKTRGRKYKKSAGLLIVIGKDENFKITGTDIRKVNELHISDLWPLGRLTIYTEKAVQDLGEVWGEKKEKIK